MTSPPPRSRLKLKAPEEQASPGLFADQRGATMVMGVFIAVLLVGMIYYVWGIGDAIMYRERIQDASDTAAFSAAVIHARGMNMLALINVVMAALAMVVSTLSVIVAMLEYAAIAAGIVCLGCAPSGGTCVVCCEACGHAIGHYAESRSADSVRDRVDGIVRPIVRGLHAYAVGIRRGVPLAAQAKVVSYGTDVYSPVTTAGVMAPLLRMELPAQDDETDWPCDNKVTNAFPVGVRTMSPILVWLWAHASIYMAGGIIAGELDAARITAEDWCEDGFFQRITDPAQTMGNDEYQVQAYMLGERDLEWTQQGVAIATWGQDEGEGSSFTRLAEMGRVSFAQAEFFYDDEDDWEEWLWHMNWRARLRRWRSSAAGLGGVMEACGGGGACGALGDLGGTIDSVVVH